MRGHRYEIALLIGIAAIVQADNRTVPAIPEPLSAVEARKLKNPVTHSRASVVRGKAIYLRHCQECHDADGRAMANVTTQATDLTAPKSWRFGASDGEIFRSIRDGAGDEMPAYKSLIKDERDLWLLVNFVHSLRPGARALLEPEAEEKSEGSPGPAAEDPKKTRNPVAYSRASIVRGKAVYLRHCQECHDADGRAMANITTEAADLTAPESWRFGTTDAETFATIRDGAGDEMPAYKTLIKDEKDLWHIVNFLKSIGPKAKRPKLETVK